MGTVETLPNFITGGSVAAQLSGNGVSNDKATAAAISDLDGSARGGTAGKSTSGGHPLTLILENESTALPEVGLPIDVAGRKVVKMSMFFTCGSRDLVSSGFDRIR